MGYDVVICGAGTAGLACAIEAGEAGARVAVVEKEGEIGGTLHLSSGQMSAAGSRLQRSKGIEDSPEQHYGEILRMGRNRAQTELLRLAVEEAPRTIDWLEELGLRFPEEQPIIYYGHDPYERPRTYWGIELGYSILNVLRPRFDELVASGAVRLLLEHRLTELVVEDGAVVGLRAVGADGEVELRGRATVLASGGYVSNPELWAELHPDAPTLAGARHTSTGDGHLAVRAIGGVIRNAETHLPTFGGIETSPGRTDIWEASPNLNPHNRLPREIYVNAAGERFIREDSPERDPCERVLLEQGGWFWIVFDEASLDEDDPLVIGWSVEMLKEFAARGQNAWVADDLRELARQAAIEPDGLVRSVERFNEAVRAGRDELGREHLEHPLATPPFYAVKAGACAVIGFAGIAVDGELRVVHADGKPIPNLYAAGEIVGAGATNGNAFAGGMMVTPALGFGRILGRKLAVREPAQAAVA
jgi:fumarate reductase flavoprotein subunit